MPKCKYKESCGFEFCTEKDCAEYEAVPMTYAERIRAMNDEELAGIIMCPYDVDIAICEHKDGCFSCCLNWLQQPESEEKP